MCIGRRIIAALLAAAGLVHAARAGFVDQSLTETFFGADLGGGRIVSGNATPGRGGLHLEADSRIRFTFPRARRLDRGAVQIRFTPPPPPSAAIPTMLADDECMCALKVRTGAGEIEISERFVRIQRYDRSGTTIDTVYSRRTSPMRRSQEYHLSVRLRSGRVTALVDGDEVAAHDAYPGDLGLVDITTYKKPFTISEFSVTALAAETLMVDTRRRIVEAGGRYRPAHFNTGNGIRNHHFITWKTSPAGDHGLIAIYATDSAIHRALTDIGAQAGNNLRRETWTDRASDESRAPDLRAQGSRVKVRLLWNDTAFTPGDLLRLVAGAPLEFRFAGNMNRAAHWRSGCIACLQSCPAGQVVNARHTIRDLMKGRSVFSVETRTPLQQEDEVVVQFSLEEQ